jgi:DeoR family transcriptional regulator, aga operon transcriptional repressor
MASLSNLERQQQIAALILREGKVGIPRLCQQFQISEATARRDLETLAAQGKLRRFHGGALAVETAPPERPLTERSTEQSAEKSRIGRAAAALVRDGQTIFLGSGTTVLELARCLEERQNLTVITNSLQAANALANAAGINLVMLGGVFRPSERSFIGHITEQALAEVRADQAFIGIRAIDLEAGLTNDYLPETLTDRAILRAARRVVLLADHSKLERVAAAYLAPLTAVQILVTDRQAPLEFTRQLEMRGLQVIQA